MTGVTQKIADAQAQAAKVEASVKAFKDHLPPILKDDFDKVLTDLKALAEADIRAYLLNTGSKVPLVGGMLAKTVDAVVNKQIDGAVGAIEG